MSIEIFFDTPGTYTIEDDGVRGNNISVVRDSFGIVVATFVHPADALKFTPNVAGVNFVINFADSLGSADVTFGNLTDPAHRPDSIVVKAIRSDGIVTLAANGSITEGGTDTAPDIVAAGIALRAEGGIGTPTNAIETQTTFIEGFSAAGGINIANIGQIQIGGVATALSGLSVNGGDIKLSAVGSIFLNDTDGAAMIQGASSSGSVTLTAIGALSDIYAVANAKVVLAPGGGITFNAGRDILIGPSGTNYDNDLLATGDIRLNAGGDVRLDGTSNLRTGAFGGVVGGDIFITAGHDINLEDTTGGLETIEAFNGDVILTTGPGGTYRQNAVFTAAVQSTDNIFINADNVGLFSGGLSTSGLGDVVIRPITPGLGIFLGTASDPFGAIGLSSDELDRIFSINLTVGSAESGRVEFVSPLMPGNVFNMVVQSGTEIFMNASLALGGSLTLRAGDDLYISPLGDFTSSGGSFLAFVDQTQDDDGAGGIASLDSVISAGSLSVTGATDADRLNGSGGDDRLFGLDGNDQLFGNGGNDRLEGGLGSDTMFGGLGDDLYIVNNASDVVFEVAGEGIDTVRSTITHTLAANVERLSLQGTTGLNGFGNTLDNELNGNSGDNLLNGNQGADAMAGAAGDDTYVVDNIGDVITEGSGNGTDLVQSSVTHTLSANVENLTLTGGNTINGFGNGLDNILLGNTGKNRLDGGTGADQMRGGAGNDVYVVDVAGDVVVEGSGNGTDRVESSVTYSLGANVENLTLTGTAAINGTGNGLDNELVGNSGSNQLNGGAGADEMRGGAGDDSFTVDNAGDTVVEAGGNGTDTVNSAVTFTLGSSIENLTLTGAGVVDGTGNAGANTITGNGSANILRGEAGLDTINGGGGADQIHGGTGNDDLGGGTGADGFRFDTALSAANNVDDILDFNVADDTVFLDRDIFTGIAADGPLAAGAFRAGTTALDADDRILYDSATGQIRYDADGVGGTAAILFATVDPGLALTNADFFAYTG